MKFLTHLQSRIFDTPLAIRPEKLEAILHGIGPRLNLDWNAENVKEFGLMAGDWSEPSDRKSYKVTDEGIAVIPIQGTLMKKASGLWAMSGNSTYERISRQVSDACGDSTVRGVLLDVDSPGGETHGMFDLNDLIYSLRGEKPIYAIANDGAMSAAYAIASAADKVFVTRTGALGSIGVFALHVDQSRLDDKAGLAFTYIHAGKKKVDGNPHEPLGKTAKSDAQTEVDREYEMFVEAVARNRNVKPQAIRDTEAAVYFAQGAVDVGLGDEVGTFEDALNAITQKVAPGSGMFSAKSVSQLPAAIAAENKEGIMPKNDDLAIAAVTGATVATQPQAVATGIRADDGDTMTCDSCGDSMHSADKFCSNCGAAAPEEDGKEKSKKTKKGKKAMAATKTEPEDDDEDDDEDNEDDEKKKEDAKKAVKAETQLIANLCTLAGFPNLAAEFIGKDFSATRVQAELLKLRSAESEKNPVGANFGVAIGAVSALDKMELQAQTLALNSGGRLSKAEAYAQLLKANPGLYEAYLDERPEMMSASKQKKAYLAALSQRMGSMGLGSELTTSYMKTQY
jgi:signal peptide peptidase SppA